MSHENEKQSWLVQYKPLFIIVGLILLASLVSSHSLEEFMRHFMAGFFLTFSGFKLINLKGFVNGYKMYDLLARRWKGWGYTYPFVELFLGLSYLTNFEPVLTNIVTLVVMGFSGIGVLNELKKKRKIKCACLGTVIDVPLTYVTLVEDFGMVLMAAAMLFFLL